MSSTSVFLAFLATILFFLLIYLKIKLIPLRNNLGKNGALIAFFEIVFWMFPVFVSSLSNNKSIRLQVLKVNIVWLITIVTGSIAFYLTIV